jgi:hypothetical protein
MGIDVFYQPIDVALVHKKILPFIFDDGDLGGVLEPLTDTDEATGMLVELRDANHCLAQGTDYYSVKWGRCDPAEFLANFCVRAVLEFCRSVYPSWHVRAISSIELLPDGFPVLDNYSMPVELFAPIINRFPDIATNLETIANCEDMGGVVLRHNVHRVRDAIVSEFRTQTRDSDNPYHFDAAKKAVEALQYAEENSIDFTEAIT